MNIDEQIERHGDKVLVRTAPKDATFKGLYVKSAGSADPELVELGLKAAIEFGKSEYKAENERLRAFIEWASQNSIWIGGDLDGFAMQDKLEEMGLLKKVPYNRELHGPNDCDVVDGDEWYVLTWAKASINMTDAEMIRAGMEPPQLSPIRTKEAGE